MLDNLNETWTDGFLDNLLSGLIFGFSAVFIIKHKMTLGSLILLQNYMPKIFNIINIVSRTNFKFTKQLAEYDKLFEIISMPVEHNGSEEFKWNTDIQFRNVSFAYSEERGNILSKLNLHIKKGEWLGIVGATGTGKTTIFDLLLKLYNPDSGSIIIDNNENYEIYSIESIRKSITKISQEPFLFPGTIRDNLININEDISDQELNQVLKKVCLDQLIESLPSGLDTEIGENGIQLSGGEKQRLSLAQGLIRKSSILLLDEVTANIDMATEQIIKKVIKELVQKQGITVISISHRLSFLSDTDRIIYLKDGRIVEEGSYDKMSEQNYLFTFL